MRKQGPMILGVVAGIIMIFSRYIFIGRNLGWDSTWNTYFLVSTAVASGLGVINLTRIHWKNIERRTNIVPSAVLLISLLGYSILGVGWTVASGPARWIYEVGNLQVTNALFSLLAFFIFSAAYRAFRVKSLESTTLLVVAAIGMMGTAPIGAAIHPSIEVAKDWLLNVPVTGAYRGILIGAYLGSFATALRILLGLERAHMSGGD